MQPIFDEMIRMQQEKVFACARKIVPYVTADDVLQPNDFPELENNPYFRYEEGVLEGMMTAQMAFFAHQKETPKKT